MRACIGSSTAVKLQVDRAVKEINAEEFDAVLLPGGAVNADRMRTAPEVHAFLKEMQYAGKPIAAICMRPGSWCRPVWCADGR